MRALDMRLVGIAVLFALAACVSTTRAAEVVFEEGIEYANPDNQHLKLNLARPKDAPGGGASMPAVVCIHGGGFRAGERTGWNERCKKLAERGYAAVTVTYRLAPKYQFPAAVNDVKAAVRWLRMNADKYHVDPNRIGAVGDSAGGHLAQFLGVTGDVAAFDGDQNPGPTRRVHALAVRPGQVAGAVEVDDAGDAARRAGVLVAVKD